MFYTIPLCMIQIKKNNAKFDKFKLFLADINSDFILSSKLCNGV